mmetsp:Transcript_26405/g.26807  ORF Transcript_26405/g.26807 Transcript_26405/m.26807 type:complete len:194 (-) Transcript_26405:63-644(-)
MTSLIPKIARSSLQAGSIMVVADAVTQIFVEKRVLIRVEKQEKYRSSHLHYDKMRTVRWGCAGLALHGPYFFVSMRRLDTYFGPASTLINAFKKTITAQVLIFPPYLFMLFPFIGALEGLPASDVMSKTKQRVPEAFLAGCLFWPVVNVFNFIFVPATMRVPYLAGLGSIWNSFLSWLNARENNMIVENENDI